MPLANKYKLAFNIQELTFEDTYPEELGTSVCPEEFDAVLRTINSELALKIQKCNRSIKKWMKIVGITSLFIIGIFLSPILLTKVSRQKKYLEEFWEKVKDYLYHVNKKTYLKRGVEWRLEQDKQQIKGRDAVNPLATYRIVIICETKKRSSTMKGKEKITEPLKARPSSSQMKVKAAPPIVAVPEKEPIKQPIETIPEEEVEKEDKEMRRPSLRRVDSLILRMEEINQEVLKENAKLQQPASNPTPTPASEKRRTVLRPKLDEQGNPILVRRKIKKPIETNVV